MHEEEGKRQIFESKGIACLPSIHPPPQPYDITSVCRCQSQQAAFY